MSLVIVYTFFKQICLLFTQFIFTFDNCYSGNTLSSYRSCAFGDIRMKFDRFHDQGTILDSQLVCTSFIRLAFLSVSELANSAERVNLHSCL